MTTEKLTQILETMATKASLSNQYRAKYKNVRECPFYSEFEGMVETLKILGIELEYEFTLDSSKMTAISARGIRVEIA